MLNKFICTAVANDAAVYDGADSIAVFLCKECLAGLPLLHLPELVEKTITKYVAMYDDCYGVETVRTLAVPVEDRIINVIIAGCGEGKECKPNCFRKTAGCVARELHKAKAEQAVFVAPILCNPVRDKFLAALVEGLYLGGYTFNKFKSDAKEAKLCTVKVVNAIENAEKILADAEIAASAVCYTRDLVNNPGNVVVPKTMADAALALAEELPLEVEVLDEKQMQEKKMQAILAVGQGSCNPPRMITLKYNGNGDAPYLAFVGKGITFDSGGISIKPDDNMGEMKDDMTGAGAVLGAMKAIAELKLKCNVIGVLACAENMPGGKAQRPGDIVRAASGKTIEVISTDAEGRMVLADGVWYACRQGAAKVVDIATLTGGVIVALGKETSGIVANDDALAAAVITAGKYVGEPFFQLPSLPECKEAIKSDVADLLNSAGRAASTITGGLFIGEFVDKDIPWAHLDIGGTSTAEKTEGFKVKGGTGFGALTLIKLAGMQ